MVLPGEIEFLLPFVLLQFVAAVGVSYLLFGAESLSKYVSLFISVNSHILALAGDGVEDLNVIHICQVPHTFFHVIFIREIAHPVLHHLFFRRPRKVPVDFVVVIWFELAMDNMFGIFSMVGRYFTQLVALLYFIQMVIDSLGQDSALGGGR